MSTSDAGRNDLMARQQRRWFTEYRPHRLNDTIEEMCRQARTTRPPETPSTLNDMAFQAVKADQFGNIACSRCHHTSPPTSFLNPYGP
ncbi:hypothetical protein ACFYNY_10270 [Streptomyces sp. NPDC006530]|uniref:hypothetical protein n=1 Tax=Streptomyces sp. NPDC006530 TaxID=3364750 RepID=UPI00368159D6